MLAVIDVPELQAQVKRDKATIKQAGSRVAQMKARVVSSEADLKAAKAVVTRSEDHRVVVRFCSLTFVGDVRLESLT